MDDKRYAAIKKLLDDRDTITTKYTLHKRTAIQVLRQVISDIVEWRSMAEIPSYRPRRSRVSVDMLDYLSAKQWLSSDEDEIFSKKVVYDQVFGVETELSDTVIELYIDECIKRRVLRHGGEDTMTESL